MGVVLMLKKDCWSWNVLKRREIFRFFTGICKRIGVYIHVYPKCRFIFSFYSASGFYIVRPVRLEQSGKASVDFIGSSLARKNKIFCFSEQEKNSLAGGTPHFAKKLYVTFPSDTTGQ